MGTWNITETMLEKAESLEMKFMERNEDHLGLVVCFKNGVKASIIRDAFYEGILFESMILNLKELGINLGSEEEGWWYDGIDRYDSLEEAFEHLSSIR